MTAEKPPIRITKQRAQAFIEAAERGIDEQIASLDEAYGVKLHRDGSFGVDQERFELLTADMQAGVHERVEQIIRAVDTAAIFRRRYA